MFLTYSILMGLCIQGAMPYTPPTANERALKSYQNNDFSNDESSSQLDSMRASDYSSVSVNNKKNEDWGEKRSKNSFAPYMATIFIPHSNNSATYVCSGAIINRLYIASTADCFQRPSELTVLVGSNDMKNSGKIYDVDKVLIHPKYESHKPSYNLALLRLASPISYNTATQKVHLPEEKVSSGHLMQLTAWDKQQRGVRFLRQISVAKVSDEYCQDMYDGIDDITPQMVCAESLKKPSNCLGKVGSPLVYKNQLVGLAAFSLGCGHLPGVYTNILALIVWIIEKLLS